MLATDIFPSEYYCPITAELMIDPVIAADGFTYERIAIEGWLQAHPFNAISPKTLLLLNSTILLPNIVLRILINDHKDRSTLDVRLANQYTNRLVSMFNNINKTAAFYNFHGASSELRQKLNNKLEQDPNSVICANNYMHKRAQLDHDRNKAFFDYYECIPENREQLINELDNRLENIGYANEYVNKLVRVFGNDIDKTAAFYNFLCASAELRQKLNNKFEQDPNSVIDANRYMNKRAQLDHDRNKAFLDYYDCNPSDKNSLESVVDIELLRVSIASQYADILVRQFPINKISAFYNFYNSPNQSVEVLQQKLLNLQVQFREVEQTNSEHFNAILNL